MVMASYPHHYSLTMLFAVLALPFVSFTQGFDFHQKFADHRKYVDYSVNLAENYERYRAECSQGEYLNLCAECVSGQTEKDDDFGKDSCGVCGGLDTCLVQCTDPLANIDEDPDEEKGCTKLISMAPNVLDLADSAYGTIFIFGDGVSSENIDGVECSLKKNDITVVNISGTILQDKVELKFPLPDEGIYNLYCNSSVGVEFKKEALVVNTNSLLPMTVDKSTIVTWTENELIVTVSKMLGPVEVICFGRDEQGLIVYKEWTSIVEGNSLSSSVVCPRVIIAKPGQIDLGIAYSEGAIESAKTVKVMGVALSPNPIGAIFLPQDSKVIIEFDQNLEESLLNGCLSMFKQSSLMIFGEDPDCSVYANEIHVIIKDNKALANTNLEFTDNVKTKFSEVAVEGSVRIDFGQIQERSPLKLEGEEIICPGDSTEVKVEGQQMGTPVWGLDVLTKNLSSANISTGQLQRLNLIKWAANRSSRAFPRTLKLNSSEIPAGMKYRVSATVKDHRGKDRQASMEVRIAKPGETWVQIHGPELLDVRGAGVYEAETKGCGITINPDKFIWKISNSRKDLIDTSYVIGPKLFLDGGLLQPNDLYALSVQAFEGETPLGTGLLNIKTMMREFKMQLTETKLVVGTGQPIEIDAGRAIDVNPRFLKFKWSCKKGYCFQPGKDKKPLNSIDSFSQPLLQLPPKSLAIGRYELEVEAVSDFGKTKSEVEVSVIGGQPPYFSRLSASDLDPGRDLELRVHVSEVHALCVFHWESVPLIGFEYIAINQSKTMMEGSPNSPECAVLYLTVAKASLKSGSKYQLRVVADCGRVCQSQLQLQVHLPTEFPRIKLQVEPREGNTLDTNFTYTVLMNGTEFDYLLHFGFEVDGVRKYLFTGYNNEFKTILGQGTVKTFVKLCRLKYDCTTVFGPEVTVSKPSKISGEVLSNLVSTYKDKIMYANLAEAKALLEMIVPSLKEIDDGSYNNFSANIQLVLINQIEMYSTRLSKDKFGLEESVKLLDVATSALTLLANNDNAMTAVLKFRNLIHQRNQEISEKKIENKISAKLPAEPRTIPEPEIYSRKKRSPESMKDENNKDPVKAMLTLSSKVSNITNDTKKIREEEIILLNYIVMYAAQFCNDTDKITTKNSGSDDGFCMIGSTRLKADQATQKLSLPQCNNKAFCPKMMGQAIIPMSNNTGSTNRSEGFCLATAYLRDDLLSNISRAEGKGTNRWGPIYWMDLLPFNKSVVQPLNNYSFLVPSINGQQEANISTIGEPIRNKGTAVLVIPLWKQAKPNGTILKCSRFENGSWNTSSCKIKKENPLKSLVCACPYPGYFSVFAVFENETKTSQVVSDATTAGTSQPHNATLPNTMAAITPTVSVPTTTVLATTTSPTATQIKNSSLIDPMVQASTRTTIHALTVTKATPTNVTEGQAFQPTTASTVTNKPVINVANMNQSLEQNNKTEVKNNTDSLTTSTVMSSTALPKPEEVTPSLMLMDYKYLAAFRINETFSKNVEHNELKFLECLTKQLQSRFNLTLPTSVQSENGLVKVTMKMDERMMKDQGHYIAALAEVLRNGTLTLLDPTGEVLLVPNQELQLIERNKSISTATTAFITVMVLFLLLLIGALISTAYLRNNREQRCHGLAQGLHDDPPAPKYLRLHDSVSLGSSGPSTPNIDMESSLAVVTRPKSRSYNTMEQFSDLPGNI